MIRGVRIPVVDGANLLGGLVRHEGAVAVLGVKERAFRVDDLWDGGERGVADGGSATEVGQAALAEL